jgi:hypothetical protein
MYCDAAATINSPHNAKQQKIDKYSSKPAKKESALDILDDHT